MKKGKREIKTNYRLYKDIWNTTKNNNNNEIELNLKLNSESCSSVSVSFLRFVFWFLVLTTFDHCHCCSTALISYLYHVYIVYYINLFQL